MLIAFRSCSRFSDNYDSCKHLDLNVTTYTGGLITNSSVCLTQPTHQLRLHANSRYLSTVV